ncbi:unnamed protein product [Acanthoscelides obtectus]|uniref:DUF7869 domain-containing protein n=1 Tax=Acanthoscelides obtectus TaxID=200917 RepID=A0A9P0PQH6_ACAOB|nr:unnamed protein product [Acanthoscelides obtectus]CAK1680717.1 hypothetical protein AOBTE_LOCUS32848 [Acanthoscelides obtectus]
MASTSYTFTESDEEPDEPFQDSGSEYLPSESESISELNMSHEFDAEPQNTENDAEQQKRSRKRVRNENKWKRNVTKTKRNLGEAYIRVLKVSDGRITRVLVNKSKAMPAPTDGRGKQPSANKTPDHKVDKVKEFIERFPSYQSHYSRKKNPHRRYLAPDLNLSIMYDLYKKQLSLKDEQPVSKYIFSEIFSKQFNLHFHAPVSDSCKKCDLLQNKLKFEMDVEKRQSLTTEMELHQRKAQSAREGMKSDAVVAKNNSEVTAIAFDLMKTLPTPVISTGISYYKRQLWTYCLGIHNLATKESFMYIWNESIASRGPQEIGSCLLHFIKNQVKTKKLLMYSDQCGGQNRNIKMALLCNYIVSSHDLIVEEINHKFLVSGHSYLPCDQDFGLIEKQKKYFKDIYVPDSWETVVKAARKKVPFKVVQMTVTDFYSTVNLEKNITNRKISENKLKVEWMKIQWLLFKKSDPLKIYFKYSNQDFAPFDSVDVSKRNSSNSFKELNLLYPKGRKVDIKKKKDLLDLAQNEEAVDQQDLGQITPPPPAPSPSPQPPKSKAKRFKSSTQMPPEAIEGHLMHAVNVMQQITSNKPGRDNCSLYGELLATRLDG